ncbi:HAMP domain-containing protein, partial [Caulobacter sp. LARHSG274]
MKFDDLKISTKVLTPAIVLTTVALACVGVGVWQSKKIEAATRVLVEQRAPTELATSRFNRQVATIGYGAYRTVANDGNSQEAQIGSRDLDAAFAKGNAYLDQAIAADPSSAKTLTGFRARLKRIHSDARQGADLGLQNANEAAVMMMGVIDPEIDSLTKDTVAWVEGHNRETQAMVAKARQDAANGAIITILFGVIASAAALIFALWIGRSKISAPLTRLSRSMETLAQGSVEVEVTGVARKDEVGAMARSVQVFKDNAVALRTA